MVGIAPAMIGERAGAVDRDEERLLNEAVGFINGQLDSMARSLIRIGEYLLERFFDGDAERARARGRRKGVSLRKLARRPDLNMSYSSLSNAVSLAVQERMLAGRLDDPSRLSESHRVLLLNVENPERKLEYARQVEEHRLTTRQLRELLMRDGFVRRRGRPSLEELRERPARARSAPEKLIEPLAYLSLEDVAIDALSPEEARSALQVAREAQAKLRAMIRRLETQAGARAAA